MQGDDIKLVGSSSGGTAMVTDVRPNLQQVRIVILERRLYPLSGTEKLKRGGKFVDALGHPKMPKDAQS